ncbi:MAG: transposase family protein, partial [candidate division NC10 bacterium]|nr:transposase family protein [candidate division NC10 bacterium]
LLAMSPATMDRRLSPSKRRLGRRLYGQTKPGRWLRQTIPIQTDSWNVPEPGWLEVDTVSHSGPSASGLFAYTLNQVDLFSGWVEMRAMLGKSAEAVVELTDEMRRAQPFGLKGMDTDNGEEFINYELDRYCRKTGVQRFRSRPYKKDDQAHIEQKNGTHVRRLIGWERYDSREAVEAMNALYQGEWRLLANLFLPSVKLANKVRVGSKIKRVYEEAKTPLDRLLESGQGDRDKLDELRRLRGRLDPFELSKTVDRKLRGIWKLASRGLIKAAPASHVPAAKPRWDELALEDNLPAALYERAQNIDVDRIRRGAWKDRYFGTR